MVRTREFPNNRVGATESFEAGVYLVEKLIKHRYRRGKREFFIKWLGYVDSENSWVPEKDVLDPQLIAQYEASLRQRRRRQQQSPPPSVPPSPSSRVNVSWNDDDDGDDRSSETNDDEDDATITEIDGFMDEDKEEEEEEEEGDDDDDTPALVPLFASSSSSHVSKLQQPMQFEFLPMSHSLYESGDANDGWSAMETRALIGAHAVVDPCALNFWSQVSAHVGNRSAEECRIRYLRINELEHALLLDSSGVAVPAPTPPPPPAPSMADCFANARALSPINDSCDMAAAMLLEIGIPLVEPSSPQSPVYAARLLSSMSSASATPPLPPPSKNRGRSVKKRRRDDKISESKKKKKQKKKKTKRADQTNKKKKRKK